MCRGSRVGRRRGVAHRLLNPKWRSGEKWVGFWYKSLVTDVLQNECKKNGTVWLHLQFEHSKQVLKEESNRQTQIKQRRQVGFTPGGQVVGRKKKKEHWWESKVEWDSGGGVTSGRGELFTQAACGEMRPPTHTHTKQHHGFQLCSTLFSVVPIFFLFYFIFFKFYQEVLNCWTGLEGEKTTPPAGKSTRGGAWGVPKLHLNTSDFSFFVYILYRSKYSFQII